MLIGQTVDVLAKSWNLQRAYNWEFLLPDINGIPGLEVSQYCRKVKFGHYYLEDLAEMRYGAYKSKYPGLMTVDAVSATFNLPAPDIVSIYFSQWKENIVSKLGFYAVKAKYARTAFVYMYDRTGQVTSRYKLFGIYPRTFPNFDLDYASEDILKLDVEFTVDKVEEV